MLYSTYYSGYDDVIYAVVCVVLLYLSFVVVVGCFLGIVERIFFFRDIEAHIRVTNEESIEKILLRHNKTKLCEAIVSPFCKGLLADTINENGKCKVAQSIVEGTYDITGIDAMAIDNKKELKMILKELVRKRDSRGNLEEDVDNNK